MFEKTLSDLVRGLRAHKANEVKQCVIHASYKVLFVLYHSCTDINRWKGFLIELYVIS